MTQETLSILLREAVANSELHKNIGQWLNDGKNAVMYLFGHQLVYAK